MNYLPFKARGSPKLTEVIDKHLFKYSKDWTGNSDILDYIFCSTNLTIQGVKRNSPKTKDLPVVSAEEFVSKIFAYLNSSKDNTMNKNKIFIKISEESKKILLDFLDKGILHTDLREYAFSRTDGYFAIGSVTEREITFSVSKEYYQKKGLIEVTPQQLKELWYPKATVKTIYNVYCYGSEKLREYIKSLEQRFNIDFHIGGDTSYFKYYLSDEGIHPEIFFTRGSIQGIEVSVDEFVKLLEEYFEAYFAPTALTVSSSEYHSIHPETSKNSKPFGLPQKQTLKIVL